MPELGPTELATGVREIDADTEGLCFVMARIFEPLAECRRRHGECDHRQCTRISAIATYLSRSFSRQDDIMDEAAYPLAAEHRLEHDALLDQLAAMQEAGVCGDRDRQVVREAVSRWLLRHNRAYDRTLANWAVTRRVLTPGE
jgi:hemerythrin-like metal-binding protein